MKLVYKALEVKEDMVKEEILRTVANHSAAQDEEKKNLSLSAYHSVT